GFAVIGLMLVLIPGIGKSQGGAQAWLALPGGFTFQPSEFTKVALITLLAMVLTERRDSELVPHDKDVLLGLSLAGIPAILVLLQNDFGTVMIIGATLLTVLVASGTKLRWVVGSLFAVLIGGYVASQLNFIKDYQLKRLATFVDPTLDPLGAGYNTLQAKIAIGSGGWFGQGYLNGPQTQGKYVPAQRTDFIFTVAGEELGFFGATLVILLMGLILYRLSKIALKAPDRLVVRMATRVGGAGGYQHYQKCQKMGISDMPVAIVLGCPPYVAFMGPQKLPIGVDEFTVAGGLANAPIHVTKAKTVDLTIPAEAEIIIEGFIDTTKVEPEGPFGESHGHIALEEYNMPMRITAITRRKKAVVPSYISQVAPSESSMIKRVAYEPLFLKHLRDECNIKGVKKVSLHEPLTGLLRVTVVTCEENMPHTEIWRSLYNAAFFKGDCSKICIAVNEDIDVDNADALLWAISYRSNPVKDIKTVDFRGQGHGPKREH
ncbi:MAG: hypothetical protein EBT51_12010, partial [Flavobacteriaceae bacterium]|nr:hypothetical protein [Flavobacteriaceae bacterium]